MKGLIESLGKTNRDFLKKTFGFKTITQAKIAFGVANKQEAYDVMRQIYNEKIEQEKKEKNEVNKMKRRFVRLMNELKNRKKTYTVAITINEVKTYNEGTDKERKYTTTHVIQKTYLASNETELENKIDNEISSHYPYDDSNVSVSTSGYSYSISQSAASVSPMDVHMKRGKPVKASFLKFAEKINPVSYEDFDGECVLRILLKHMDIKKDKTLISDFNEASLELYDEPYDKKKGVTSRMILHMCKLRNISCLGFDQREKNFVKFTADHSKKRKFKPIVFYMFMSHFYLITDPSTILSIAATFRQNNNVFHSSLEVGENDNKKENVTFYSNLPVSQCLELEENSIVIYDKNDLNDELKQYISLTNDIPKVKNQTITQVGKISFGKNIQLVISGALGEGLEWRSIQSICEKAAVPFNNQSLGQLLVQIRDKFFVVNRAKFTSGQREEIKNEQASKCIICQEVLKEKYHIDHIKPLVCGGTNERDNLQALCVSCHIEKSRDEKEACEYIQSDNITSAFNIQALRAIESDWFRKVAFTQPIGNVDRSMWDASEKFCKDENKCRRNILLNYGYDFPRYSVLDDIESFDGKLETGFYYIETENTFPLRGNGFYATPAVKFTLDRNIISMNDIKYQFKSSFSIKSDYFKPFVEHLDFIFSGDESLKKLAVNSLVGLFGRRKNSFVENRMCDRNELEDIACAYQDFYKPYLNVINSQIVQVAGQSEVKKIESAFPIHAQILDCEAIELYKLVEKIKQHGGIPYEVKTDAVNYFAVAPVTFSNDADNFWDSSMELPKYKDERAKDLLRAVMIENDERFILRDYHYEHWNENDDFDELAKTIIDSKKGCLILGAAGTGKTYLINQMKKRLESEQQNFKCVAPTNKATLLMNGETLHKFSYSLLNSKKQLKKYKALKYLFVDETSMVQEIFYQVLMILKHYNPDLKIIMVGDFGQLPPVNDRVRKDYQNSRALWELVDGNKLELTKCRRSDNTHFQNCMNVRYGRPIDLNKFTKTENTYLNICFTNKMRKMVNEECMERFLKENRYKKAISYEQLKYDKNSQDMKVCEGMPVIARINQKSFDVVNNEMFAVKKINSDSIIISNELKNEVVVPIDKFHKIFYLGFCITIHKSQGATFETKYTIYEWEKQCRKMKYVALSRATDEKLIQIVV